MAAVADALELSGRDDWPDFDRCVRLIFQLSYGDPEDDGLMAETLLESASGCGGGRRFQRLTDPEGE